MTTDVMAQTAIASTPVGHAAAKRSITHRVTSAVMSLVVLVLAVGFVIAAVAVGSGHWKAGPVVSGSMEPTIHTGSVVLTQKVPVADLAVGDIVMFQRPDEADEQVVHRIAQLEPSQDGPLIRTKGDANATEDPWQVRPQGDTAWVARGSVPYVGYVALATRTAVGQHALFTGAGLLIVAGLVLVMRPSKKDPEAVSPARDTRDAPRRNPRRSPPPQTPPTTVVQRMHHPPLTRSSNTMQFSNKKKAVAGALIAVGGLALIGAGTGASFTDTVTANSTFKTGSVDLDIIDAPNYDVSADGNTATLKGGTVNFNTPGWKSSFDTIKVINNGDIKVPLNVDVQTTGLATTMGMSARRLTGTATRCTSLAPGDSAFISIWYDYEITDADSGKTGTFSVSVSGTSA